MSIVHDMSDEGLVSQFGDLMHELPELYEALRRFEIESRPAKSGLKMSINGRGNETRIRVGNSGRME
jgi:hypothetical protein